MMARWSRRSRTVVRWTASIAIIAIVGYFFASALAANWEQVVELDIQFNAWSVGAIVLFPSPSRSRDSSGGRCCGC